VGQIRVVFSLPKDETQAPSERLAYVEWFTKFTSPESNHGMYKLNRSMEGGARVASIIPVSSIRRSIHLFPRFDHVVPEDWTSDNVLENCNTFYLNPLVDRNMHFIL
jgi:hypothetical protein